MVHKVSFMRRSSMSNDILKKNYDRFNRTKALANMRAMTEALRAEKMASEQNANVNTAPEKTISRENA